MVTFHSCILLTPKINSSQNTPQISKFDDVHVVELEKYISEDEPLNHDIFLDLFVPSCNEKEGSQGDEDVDVDFHISSHIMGVHCYKFYGDPIYDIDLDDSRKETAEFCLWSSHV
jgi:hypothetical protein